MMISSEPSPGPSPALAFPRGRHTVELIQFRTVPNTRLSIQHSLDRSSPVEGFNEAPGHASGGLVVSRSRKADIYALRLLFEPSVHLICRSSPERSGLTREYVGSVVVRSLSEERGAARSSRRGPSHSTASPVTDRDGCAAVLARRQDVHDRPERPEERSRRRSWDECERRTGSECFVE
jgi:hypothetical protein